MWAGLKGLKPQLANRRPDYILQVCNMWNSDGIGEVRGELACRSKMFLAHINVESREQSNPKLGWSSVITVLLEPYNDMCVGDEYNERLAVKEYKKKSA